MPNKPRVVVKLAISCNGEKHKLGIRRNGQIVYLNHMGEAVARWENMAAMGGELPNCFRYKVVSDLISPGFAEADPGIVGYPVASGNISRKTEDQIFKINSRFEQRKAKRSPGEAKRSRKLVVDVKIGLRKKPKPPTEPTSQDERQAHDQARKAAFKSGVGVRKGQAERLIALNARRAERLIALNARRQELWKPGRKK